MYAIRSYYGSGNSVSCTIGYRNSPKTILFPYPIKVAAYYVSGQVENKMTGQHTLHQLSVGQNGGLNSLGITYIVEDVFALLVNFIALGDELVILPFEPFLLLLYLS